MIIYLIGGPPRAGKSTLAEYISKKEKISRISTDILRDMLSIHPSTKINSKLTLKEKDKLFFPYLKRAVRSLNWSYKKYIIEGEILTPKQIIKLKKYFNTKEFLKQYSDRKVEIRACFLGYTSMTEKELSGRRGYNDWISNLDNKEICSLSSSLSNYSNKLKKECEKYNIKYFNNKDIPIREIKKLSKKIIRSNEYLA